MYAYKLTTQDMKTRRGGFNEVTWELHRQVTAVGKGNELCSPAVIHSYSSPLLAVLLNPIHADIQNPRLFKARCTKVIATDGLKQGHTSMTLVSELEVPTVTTNQRIAFAILCSLEVEQSESYKLWAQGWLLNRDRTATTASAVSRAAYAAADAVYAAADAAYDSARAAYAAAYAAADAAYDSAYAAYAAYDSARAAYAAAYAAYAAADAVNAAARAATNKKIDFVALAEKAMKFC